MFDKNNDGFISTDEFINTLGPFLNVKKSNKSKNKSNASKILSNWGKCEKMIQEIHSLRKLNFCFCYLIV